MKKQMSRMVSSLLVTCSLFVGIGVGSASALTAVSSTLSPTHVQAPVNGGTVGSTASLTADEQQMLNLVNAERAKVGLRPLQVDMRVVQTARAKSLDMVRYNYFSHYSARLGSPFDQLRMAGVRYMMAGENIAGNSSVLRAHLALMNSPGHRANILNPRFTKIGIGIIRGGWYSMMFTQQFTG